MKDQNGKAALKKAFLVKVAEAAPGNFEAQALEVAAVTLALEAGARQGLGSEALELILKEASSGRTQVQWAAEHLAHARAVMADPNSAEGIWKEALSVLQPLGMDIG